MSSKSLVNFKTQFEGGLYKSLKIVSLSRIHCFESKTYLLSVMQVPDGMEGTSKYSNLPENCFFCLFLRTPTFCLPVAVLFLRLERDF